MTSTTRATVLLPRPRRGVRLAVATSAAALAVPLLVAPAASATSATSAAAAPAAAVRSSAAATTGLFGSADPTYDGVYRQSLGILGLRAAGLPVPVPAARWLRLQQCSGGAFQSYRADIAVPCTASNPATYSGPDTNSTALAAMALLRLGDTARARKALAWLRAVQRPDGGFPYYRGGASDTNSTGLVLAALRAGGTAPSRLVSSPGGRTPAQFLQSVQVRCRGTAADRGALAYQGPAPLVPNPLASAQGALGLAGTLPVTAARPAVRLPALSCSGGGQLRPIGISDVANGWLGRSILAGGGSLPNAFGPGRDWSATGWAVLALVAGRDGRDAVAQGTWRLARAAKTYVRPAGSVDQPGALGLLLLVAKATGRPVVSFGGVDLPARLRATMRG